MYVRMYIYIFIFIEREYDQLQVVYHVLNAVVLNTPRLYVNL